MSNPILVRKPALDSAQSGEVSQTDILNTGLATQNYIINGDMAIAQRGTTFTSPGSGSYTLDRFVYVKNSGATHTISQDTDVPTFAQAGYAYQNSIRLNLTTADTSIAAGEFVALNQYIEGYNWAQISQKPFTLSFWVKATLNGIYTVAFSNSGDNREYVAEYTINSANTWEYKTITVSAAPTTGTWNYTNGVGLRIKFVLAAGSSFQTTANTWQTSDVLSTTNAVNGVNTGATDFRLTGIVLNTGTIASPFSLYAKVFDQEFLACLRYYEKSFEYAATPSNGGSASTFSTDNGLEQLGCVPWTGSPGNFDPLIKFRVIKRAAPTLQQLGNNSGFWCYSSAGSLTGSSSRTFASTIAPSSATTVGFRVVNNVTTSVLFGVQGHWTVDAEL